jgi:hypothetical protein
MEPVKLFNYKGKDILIRKLKDKYHVGISSENGIIMWVNSISYDTPELAINSGREYARILIDRMILSSKSG